MRSSSALSEERSEFASAANTLKALVSCEPAKTGRASSIFDRSTDRAAFCSSNQCGSSQPRPPTDTADFYRLQLHRTSYSKATLWSYMSVRFCIILSRVLGPITASWLHIFRFFSGNFFVAKPFCHQHVHRRIRLAHSRAIHVDLSTAGPAFTRLGHHSTGGIPARFADHRGRSQSHPRCHGPSGSPAWSKKLDHTAHTIVRDVDHPLIRCRRPRW